MPKVLPTTPKRLHQINGESYETNIRQDENGRCFLSLFNENDLPVAEVPYDPSNPDASMAGYIEKLNEAVSRIPGKKAKRLPPNASQSAAIQSRFARLSFDGSVFSEAP